MKLHEYLGKPLAVYEGKISPFPTADFMGIEVELEDVDLPRDDRRLPNTVLAPKGWVFHIDDSLRNNGLEFVFDGPVAGVEAATRLEGLITWIKDNKLKPDASDRTSVHIHLDARDCSIQQLFKWLLIYTVYEPLLFEVYAADRKKSNFCVPVYDSFETRKLIVFLKKSFPTFFKELGRLRGTHRYSAVNLDALHKFGSLEFRHLGGTYKPKPIMDWATVLMCLKAWAMDDSTGVNEIFHGPSRYYCQQMTGSVFNDDIAEKMFELGNFTELYLEGARTAQEIFLDEKIPDLPPILLPRINEIKQQKRGKKIQMLREQVNKLKMPETLANIPTVRETLQHANIEGNEILGTNAAPENLWRREMYETLRPVAVVRGNTAPRVRPNAFTTTTAATTGIVGGVRWAELGTRAATPDNQPPNRDFEEFIENLMHNEEPTQDPLTVRVVPRPIRFRNP